MKLPEFVRHPNPHAERWRLLDLTSRSIARDLFAHCDDYGLVCIERIEVVRLMVEQKDLREHIAAESIQRIVDVQVAYLYSLEVHGRILAFPDFPAANRRQWPRTSSYLPIPFEILMAEPGYASIIAKYGAATTSKAKEHEETLPQKQAVIEKYNAFATEHKLFLAHGLTPERSKHLDHRLAESLFDFDKILESIAQSPFLLGKVAGNEKHTPFRLTLEFIIKDDEHYPKILQGFYSDRRGNQSAPGQTGPRRPILTPDINTIHSLGERGGSR